MAYDKLRRNLGFFVNLAPELMLTDALQPVCMEEKGRIQNLTLNSVFLSCKQVLASYEIHS